jgi:hypothetical protein
MNFRSYVLDKQSELNRFPMPSYVSLGTRVVPNGLDAYLFARPRGYVVMFRTDTGKPHIAKPRRACSAR